MTENVTIAFGQEQWTQKAQKRRKGKKGTEGRADEAGCRVAHHSTLKWGRCVKELLPVYCEIKSRFSAVLKVMLSILGMVLSRALSITLRVDKDIETKKKTLKLVVRDSASGRTKTLRLIVHHSASGGKMTLSYQTIDRRMNKDYSS